VHERRVSRGKGRSGSAWRRLFDLARFGVGICRFALDAARLMLMSRLAATTTRRAEASGRYGALRRPAFPLQPVQQAEGTLPLGVERQ